MKYKFLRVFIAILLVISLVGTGPFTATTVHAGNFILDMFPEFAEYQDKFAEFFADVDEEIMPEVFDFLQEKVTDGSLSGESAVDDIIKESKQRFGTEIAGGLNERHVETMVELVTTLEDMGFNTESIIENARSMYEEYGMDFVNHVEEIIVEAVKDSLGSLIKNAIRRFFVMIGDFFKNLFKSVAFSD